MVDILTRRVKKGLAEEVTLELDLKTKRIPGSQSPRELSPGRGNSRFKGPEMRESLAGSQSSWIIGK